MNKKVDNIIINNNFFELAFKESGKGALCNIIDKKTGFDFIRDKSFLKDLFKIFIKNRETREIEEIGSSGAKTFKWNKKDNASNYRLILEYVLFTENELKVIIEIKLSKNSYLSKWLFSINNKDDKRIIYKLACPIIPAVSKPGEKVEGESVATSMNGEGYLFKDPSPMVNGIPLKKGEKQDKPDIGIGEIHNLYPGNQCMQFFLFFNNKAGLYLATHDSNQNVKSFDLGKMEGLGENPVMSISHFLEDKEKENISIEYDTVLGVFHGDWYDGAQIYKNWATKQWWCEKKLWDRDIPDWMREGFGIFSMSNYNTDNHTLNHSLNEIADLTNKLSKDTGTRLLSLILNWEGGGAWTGPVGFFPPREGANEFKKAIQKLKRAGNYGFIYLLLDIWYLNVPFDADSFDSWAIFESEAKNNAITKDDGKILMESFYQNWKSTRICPHTKYAQKLINKFFLKSLKMGVSMIQLDCFPIGKAQACYNSKHGHPMGYGEWWAKSCNEIIKNLRNEAKNIKSDFAITTEGVCENFIQNIDIYDNRNSIFEYFSHLEKGLPMNIELIPIFNFVYHEYIGSYTSFAPEFSLPEDLDLYWTRCLGKSLAQGVIPTGGLFVPESKKLNKTVIEFYKKVIRASVNECWEYLMFGEMLKPPKINLPAITIVYSRLIPPGVVENKRHELKDSPIQYSVWRARDGSIAYFFINISKEKLEFKVDLSSCCNKNCYDIDFIIDGKRNNYKKNFIILNLSEHCLEIKPLSIIVVEIYHGKNS
ncbi:MAG: DUF6259 domain-containing protein [Actinobacteria bacterium]|nr:DUF6259 domain-containing protein [Actinomycetota bacterium]